MYPMAHIIVKNNSSKAYECVPYGKWDECRTLSSQQEIKLMIHPAQAKNSNGEAHLEFYDPADKHLPTKKTVGLCLFILYSEYKALEDGQTQYLATLEQKTPGVAVLKNFAIKITNANTIKFIIRENLQESEFGTE